MLTVSRSTNITVAGHCYVGVDESDTHTHTNACLRPTVAIHFAFFFGSSFFFATRTLLKNTHTISQGDLHNWTRKESPRSTNTSCLRPRFSIGATDTTSTTQWAPSAQPTRWAQQTLRIEHLGNQEEPRRTKKNQKEPKRTDHTDNTERNRRHQMERRL